MLPHRNNKTIFFRCKITGRTFEAQLSKGGYLTPLWVKTSPENWERIYRA